MGQQCVVEEGKLIKNDPWRRPPWLTAIGYSEGVDKMVGSDRLTAACQSTSYKIVDGRVEERIGEGSRRRWIPAMPG